MRDMPRDDGRLGRRNILLAVLAGAVSSAAVCFFGVPGLDPSLWGETAAAAGLRPPQAIFPGLWRLLALSLISLFGQAQAVFVLRIIGVVCCGACVAVFSLIIRQILALVIHTSRPYAVWSRIVAPFFAFAAALMFGLGDPMSRISAVLSPDLLRLSMFLLSVHWVLRWFTVGGQWRLFPSFFLMGVMAAETPFAFLLPVLFVAAYAAVWRCVIDGLFMKPEKLPEPHEMPKWRMFFIFLGALAAAVWVNVSSFVHCGGLEANGWEAGDIYFRYLGGCWRVFAGAATVVGWALGVGVCLLPLVVSLRIFPRAVRDDQPMPFNYGVMLFFVGVLAAMQSGAFPAARFWTYTKESALVYSGFLLAFFHACAMVSFALFGAGFTFECHRKYMTDEDGARPGKLLRVLVPMLTIGLVILAAFRVRKPVESEMQSIVDDVIAEILEECGDAKWLFTDGRLDAGVEIAAAAAGKDLKTLDMMSGSSEWDRWVRVRGFAPGSSDYEIAETGIPALLRVWAGEKTNGMDQAALQLGFEFWKREKKPLPKVSGVLARVKGLSDSDATNGIARAQAISGRILAVSDKIDAADPSPALSSAFSAVVWRLSRFARLREDRSLADELDLANTALKRMLSVIEYERTRTFMQLTPREGLRLALRRTDFAEARRYSTVVLMNDEDDPEANFAMGMGALMAKNLKDAEIYLKRCLKRRPKEPAVLNNLSIICRKQRRWKEAEEFARKAMEILPDSAEVKQTLADALEKAP